MGSARILKAGDPCPCCGSPIQTTNPVMLGLLTLLRDELEEMQLKGELEAENGTTISGD